MSKNENLGKRVGDNVRKLRFEKHITQEKLSEISGVSINTIRNLEKGRWPSANTLAAVANALNIDAKFLLANKDDKLYLKEEIDLKIKNALNSILSDYSIPSDHIELRK